MSRAATVTRPRDREREFLNALVAAEFGYKCCEQGKNIQETLAELRDHYYPQPEFPDVPINTIANLESFFAQLRNLLKQHNVLACEGMPCPFCWVEAHPPGTGERL